MPTSSTVCLDEAVEGGRLLDRERSIDEIADAIDARFGPRATT